MDSGEDDCDTVRDLQTRAETRGLIRTPGTDCESDARLKFEGTTPFLREMFQKFVAIYMEYVGQILSRAFAQKLFGKSLLRDHYLRNFVSQSD